MDRQMVDAFNKLIDTELEKISKMPALNDAVLNNLHKLTDTKKNLLKIDKLEMEVGPGMMDGYSNRRMDSSYDYNRDMMSTPIYHGGSYDMGYSRTDARSHLEAAMRDARSEQEREEIRQLMMRYPN